jgi:hexosaminidase
VQLCQTPFVPPNSPVIPSEIWPLPVTFETGSVAAAVSPSLEFICGSTGCPDPLPAAFERYLGLIFFAGTPAEPQAGENVITQVVFDIVGAVDLVYGFDESYSFSVPSSGAIHVTATTQWGALRALESISQLIIWQGVDAQRNQYLITNTPIEVNDNPRFAWRGFLIDTSFNYQSVVSIQAILDAMSYAKFNILHWHATDDPSWPIVSSTYSNFSTFGPYSSRAIYTIEDQLTIKNYAWERGILILMELDMPGHASIWKAGNPSYVIDCPGGQPLLNPIESSNIYVVIQQLIQEYTQRFPGMPFIHLGTDGESYLCPCMVSAECVLLQVGTRYLPSNAGMNLRR